MPKRLIQSEVRSINIRQQDHSETGSMYCIIKCIVQGKQAQRRFASSVLHSCNVKTQICVTRPQCVNGLVQLMQSSCMAQEHARIVLSGAVRGTVLREMFTAAVWCVNESLSD